jgi:hypothetical protein
MWQKSDFPISHIFKQAALGRAIRRHAAVPLQVVWRQIKNCTHARVKATRELQLVG